jgi:16S rRNA (guanine966-N2)-methyltransferase
MRIVAGTWRGRAIATLPAGDTSIRPTSDRAREAVFNILFSSYGPLDGTRVLDMCCGTGALGLEALSRGATHATFIDNSATALRLVKQSVQTFGAQNSAVMLLADATDMPVAAAPCDIVFCDPPYGRGIVPLALAEMHTKGWLAPHATVVVEVAAKEIWDVPHWFTLNDERVYGAAKVAFFTYSAAAAHGA